MMNQLDELLGRITMYRLVLYSLVALVVMALVLMFVGTITYSPLSFIVAVIVSVGCAYGTNRLLGWLFTVKPHGESAIITGLILALLFAPPESLLGFIKLGLVVAIAMASKYLIAPRGRHIFNPAAFAIVIASISGVAYAGWWVATPGMIPITILAGVLILRRTKKQYISMVFVVTAATWLWLQGTDPYTALTSWPLLFVGAIMLSEPLTLPPRAWQQYLVAVVVGLLATTPMHYWRITMTPALALVIGNVIGWWFGQRRVIKLRYAGKKQMASDTYELTFDTQGLVFEPGQYLELSVPHQPADSRGQRRIFSIVGSPGDEQISIGTKIPNKPSSFKRTLMNLRTGDTVYATRVAGDFVLPKESTAPVVCIAGGIGVTPFVSYALSSDMPFQLIYAVTRVSDLSHVDQLRHHMTNVTIVSSDDGKLPDPEWRHITGRLDEVTLSKLIDVQINPIVYISGPPAMVAATKKIVQRLGVRRIKVDEFSGY